MAIERFKELYENPLPERRFWVGGGLLPKSGITLLGAAAKVGKSHLLLDLAHDLCVGDTCLWGIPEFRIEAPARTLYVDFEIGKAALQQRIVTRYDRLQKSPPDNLYYISRPVEMYLDTTNGARNLAKAIEEMKAEVVIIDPVGRCIVGQENDSGDIGKLFRHLDELIKTYPPLSIVLSHHAQKPSRNDSTDTLSNISPYRLRGSGKFFDCPDAVIMAEKQSTKIGDEWWRIQVGFEFRQAPGMEPVMLAVNAGGLITVAEKKPILAKALKSAKPLWGRS